MTRDAMFNLAIESNDSPGYTADKTAANIQSPCVALSPLWVGRFFWLMSKHRTHSPEFKARVGIEAISGHKTIQEIPPITGFIRFRWVSRSSCCWTVLVSCWREAKTARTRMRAMPVRLISPASRCGRDSCPGGDRGSIFPTSSQLEAFQQLWYGVLPWCSGEMVLESDR